MKELLPLSHLLGLRKGRAKEEGHTVRETEDMVKENCLVDAT